MASRRNAPALTFSHFLWGEGPQPLFRWNGIKMIHQKTRKNFQNTKHVQTKKVQNVIFRDSQNSEIVKNHSGVFTKNRPNIVALQLNSRRMFCGPFLLWKQATRQVRCDFSAQSGATAIRISDSENKTSKNDRRYGCLMLYTGVPD